MRRLLLALLLALSGATALAQINSGTVPYIFVPNTVISSTEVNTNFSTVYSDALNRTGGTMTGTLNARHIIPVADNTYDLGSGSFRWRNLYVTGTIGSSGGALAIYSTTPPQLTVGYDVNNKMTVSVTSTGAVTFDASGSGASFTFADPVTFNGAVTFNGTVTLTGGMTFTSAPVYSTATANSFPYTLTTATGVLFADGTGTINMYSAVGQTGRTVVIKNIGTGTITIDGSASETIDGDATLILNEQWRSVTLISNGTNWNIL